jgi:F420-dependent oxidoreductase-like protein
MRFVIFVEPQQGATYADQLRVAQHAEELGFDAFFRSDHFLTMGGGDGRPGPTDAWITLGALAVQTSRIRLGTLVTSSTFRLPGVLATTVAQVDEMSGGRIELGLGAGWYGQEHTAYGIPFPGTGERFDRLAEQLAIITGLWTTPVGEKFSFDGAHYQVQDSPALPKPVQSPHPPVIIGGRGPTRTPALAVRYADEYNVPFASVADTVAAYDRVRAAGAAIDRDLTGMVFSAAQPIAVGRTDAEATARADFIGGRKPAFFGTPDQVVDRIGQFAEAGASRMFLQIMDMSDLDQLDVIAGDVVPQLRQETYSRR